MSSNPYLELSNLINEMKAKIDGEEGRRICAKQLGLKKRFFF